MKKATKTIIESADLLNLVVDSIDAEVDYDPIDGIVINDPKGRKKIKVSFYIELTDDEGDSEE